MNRRTFLKSGRQTKATARGVQTGLGEYSGDWTYNEVAHLLKRTMFGVKKVDADHFLTMNCSDAVDELLNNIQSVSPPLREYGLLHDNDGSLFEDTGVTQGQTWINNLIKLSDPGMAGAIKAARIDSLRKWWVGIMLNQNRSIGEKMLLFWHHHFSVQREEVDNATHLYRHHDLLRTNVLGNIKALTKKVTVDPAMLIHLNGYLNSKRAPDENYARELQELMTVGKGDDSLYTESDVQQAAKLLTGWRISDDTLTAYLDTDKHDTSTKSFSAFYNNTSIPGSSNGEQEIDQFIEMIFATNECPKFICRKLYRWFVYYQIDDNTEATVISPLANILRNNNFEIKPVLSALLKSDHFFDKMNQACYIKSPYGFLVGTLRELDIAIPAYTDYANGYPVFKSIYDKAAQMQQDLFQPPDVSGWPSYYQDPMYHELWVNSNSLPGRASFTDDIVKDNMINLKAFAQYSSDPSDPDKLIEDFTVILLRYPLSDSGKQYAKNNFLINNSSDKNVWTNAWNTNDLSVINSSLGNLLKFIMNLPEFHLC
ncbi:MAG: DUF1800 domain-containing protein [Chitinophagaceae bacterium]|nr:DUF1800 domain-containing protein [Chitinophagaceae bacterium]